MTAAGNKIGVTTNREICHLALNEAERPEAVPRQFLAAHGFNRRAAPPNNLRLPARDLRRRDNAEETLIEKTDAWLSAERVAVILDVSYWTVLREIKRGRLPSRRIGGRYRVLESEVRAYLQLP